MTSGESISVLLVDDQDLVRSGFAMLLDASTEIVVVGEASDGEAAIDLVGTIVVDVVLMDIRMRGMGGVAATKEITRRSPERPRVLMLTTYDDDAALYEALDAGAAGFLLKDCRATELIAAIRAVHDGGSVIAPALMGRMLTQLGKRPGGLASLISGAQPMSAPTSPSAQDLRLALLTPREVEVLAAVGRGWNNAQIAQGLFLAEATVKTHLARIMHKVAARSRVQLVLLAHSAGLVAVPRQD